MLTILILLVAVGTFALLGVKNAGENPDFKQMFKQIFDKQPLDEGSRHIFDNIQSEVNL